MPDMYQNVQRFLLVFANKNTNNTTPNFHLSAAKRCPIIVSPYYTPQLLQQFLPLPQLMLERGMFVEAIADDHAAYGWGKVRLSGGQFQRMNNPKLVPAQCSFSFLPQGSLSNPQHHSNVVDLLYFLVVFFVKVNRNVIKRRRTIQQKIQQEIGSQILIHFCFISCCIVR
jgi:hypothetical protein